ncbi:MAG: hypothetical protein MUF18_08305, partial [Fimbriiglobus sp.]|nr:hypothetical protein [Fimbriiglobus sp.]
MSFILRFLPRLFQLLASLKVTVVLFVLSSLLVFFGTLAQKGQGVWTVVDNYFYSWWVKVEVKYLLEFGKVFLGVRPDATSAAWFPFPAGKLLGWAMVVNLTAAHVLLFAKLVSGLRKQAARSRSTAAEIGLLLLKRSGIIVLHAGVLAMLLGEYVTREFAVEQQMLIEEGKSANYAYETRNFEIAFVDRTDPAADKVAVLPSRKLKDAVEARDRARRYGLPLPSTRFTHDALPVDVEVLEYFPNSKVEAVTDALQTVLRKALPNATDPARKEVTDDAAVLLQAFQEATA